MRSESAEISDIAEPATPTSSFDMMPEEITPELKAIERQRVYDQLQGRKQPSAGYEPQDQFYNRLMESKRALARKERASEERRKWYGIGAATAGAAATGYALYRLFEHFN